LRLERTPFKSAEARSLAFLALRLGQALRRPAECGRGVEDVDGPCLYAHIGMVRSARIRMADPLSRFATRLAYGASQLARVAWYVGHREVMRRLSEQARRRSGESIRPPAHTQAPVPDRWRLYADMAKLFRTDL